MNLPLDTHDVIVVGSGPGGATLAHEMAHKGQKVLLERGIDHRFDPSQVYLIERRFIGGAYKQPSAEGPASQEGILLDPIYTAKAFTGLLDLASRGQTAGDEPRIYLHTDGLPALFAREDGSLEHA